MLAEHAEEPFSAPGWVFELKHDGFRLLAARAGQEVRLRYRSGASTAQNLALDVGTDLQFLWERRDGPGGLALHVYPLSFLRFELLSSFGTGAARTR